MHHAATTSGEIGVNVDVSKRAGLSRVTDLAPGLARERRGSGFLYRNTAGRIIRDPKTLARIRALAIPPAWRDVWICQKADGHLQATGRDQRGRKQYRYHRDWVAARSAQKFGRMMAFAADLPTIRERVAVDMRRPISSREGVLATIVALLERTLIRIGNREYARANGSFGLTTLLDRHLQIQGRRLTFRFRGKSGVWQEVILEDAVLARRLKRYRELPGPAVFQYLLPDGTRHTITSADVNAYLGEVTRGAFTAKDFRTWAATVRAAVELSRLRASAGGSAAHIKTAVQNVARRLGNTVAVCRSSYIHPAVLDAYRAGVTIEEFLPHQKLRGLHPAEAALAAMLKHRPPSPQRAAA